MFIPNDAATSKNAQKATGNRAQTYAGTLRTPAERAFWRLPLKAIPKLNPGWARKLKISARELGDIALGLAQNKTGLQSGADTWNL